MQPYSLDLRRRIVEAHEAGEGSLCELAERFAVHRNTVRAYLRAYRQTGSLEPRPHGGGAKAKLDKAALERLASWVARDNDRTQAELAEALAHKAGVTVHRATVGRALGRLRLTRKKKICTRPSATRPRFGKSAPPS